MCVIMVCHIEAWLGTKVVKSALRMLALYMYFNGTGIWGGETMYTILFSRTLAEIGLHVNKSR